MSSLYELTKNFLEAQEMLFDEDVKMETILNTLDCIDCLIEEKADNYAKIMKYVEGQILITKSERERLYNREKMLEKRCKKLKEHLKQCMEVTGKTKFETALYSFSIQKNGGVDPLKIDVDVDEIPPEYLIPQPPKPNTEAIRKAINKGEVISFAHLEERETSLRIR